MYEQVDFHFRHQPVSGTPYAVLLKYLDREKNGSRQGREHNSDCADDLTEFSKKQMVLWALSAYWYPSACKALGSFSKTQLRQKARNAIYQLLQQIYYLIQMFELDPQEFVFPISTEALNSGSKVSSSRTSEEILDAAHPFMPSPSNASPESKASEQASLDSLLTRNEDDVALDEAFVD